MITRAYPFEPDVRPQSIQAEQEPFLDDRTIQVLSHRQALKLIGKLHPQVRLLEEIQQFDHRPAVPNFGFEQPQMERFWLWR
jgi:hypothetical protein